MSDQPDFLSKMRAAARRAEKDPEGFKRMLADGVQRVREGAEKLSAAGDALQDAVNGKNPQVRTEMENYFLSLLGRGVGEAMDQRAARPAPQPARPKKTKRATSSKSRQRARPRDPGVVEGFMESVFYGKRR